MSTKEGTAPVQGHQPMMGVMPVMGVQGNQPMMGVMPMMGYGAAMSRALRTMPRTRAPRTLREMLAPPEDQ